MSLPPSGGFDQVWVVVDRLTHWVSLVPASATDDSAITARRLFDGVFALFGLPGLITSDNDSRLCSAFSRTLMDLAGVSRFVTPPERKQGNGLAERTIRSLRAYVRTSCDALDWHEKIPAAMHAFNTSFSAAVGASPAQLLLGYQPRGPLEAALPADHLGTEAGAFLRRRATLQQQARTALFEGQVDRLRRANLARTPPENWAPGDLAFVSTERITVPWEDHLPPKLRSAFAGPFPVVDVTPPNRTLQLAHPYREREARVNVEDAFRFLGAPPAETSGGVLAEPDVSEGEDDNRPLYRVRRLLQHRVVRGTFRYKVDWVADRPTWEAEDDISPDLLVAYWATLSKRPRVKIPPGAERWINTE